MTLSDLDKDDRLRLIRFVCSFAWADLHVNEKEKQYVRGLVKKLKLTVADAKQAEQWLKVPPRPEEVDPAEVPLAHREIFLKAAREVILADGDVDPEEQTSFTLLEQLLR